MNNTTDKDNKGLDRRDFFRAAGAGLSAATVVLNPAERALAQFKHRQGSARARSRRARGRFVIFKQRPEAAAVAVEAAAAGRRGCAAPAGTRPAREQRQRRQRDGAGWCRPRPPVVQRSPSNGGWTTEQMKAKYGEITMLDFPQFTKDTFPGVTQMDLFSGLFGDVTDDTHVRRRGTFDPLTPSGASGWSSWPRDGEDRHEGPAHLQQRAVQSGRAGRGRSARRASRWPSAGWKAARCSA